MKKENEVNKSQKEYIRNNLNLSPEELSIDTGLSVKMVKVVLQELSKPKPKSKPYIVDSKGGVQMTQSASMDADEEFRGHKPGINKAFMDRYKKNIHIIEKKDG